MNPLTQERRLAKRGAAPDGASRCPGPRIRNPRAGALPACLPNCLHNLPSCHRSERATVAGASSNLLPIDGHYLIRGKSGAFVSSLSDGHRMGVPPQKRRLSPSRRRALELLASSPDGATKETLVRVYGISRDIIAGLVRAGLATVRHDTVRAGSEMIRVKRYRITNAGRMALDGWPVRFIRLPR
jgi:hypothetical protein